MGAPAAQKIMPETRRFPLPWTTEDNGARFIIRDANGLAMAYVYYGEEPGWVAITARKQTRSRFRLGSVLELLPQLQAAQRAGQRIEAAGLRNAALANNHPLGAELLALRLARSGGQRGFQRQSG
jgi:hypothetical protein